MDRSEVLNDSEEAMRLILEGWQFNMWTAIPGIVKSVNWNQMTCEVQPTLQQIFVDQNNNQTSVNLPLLLDCPIVFPGAGNFILTMPITTGDEVLVIIASRCIDAWWQSGGIQQAMEARMHDLSDGFVIPGPKSIPNVVSNISSTTAQLRNKAGTTYVEIDATGNINLISPGQVNITAPAVNVTGALVVSGALTAATLATSGGGGASVGALNATSVTADGVSLATHIHSGVTSGGSDSGPPV